MRSERLTILVTPDERAAIASRADLLGVSSSEVLRLAFSAYEECPDREELELLAGILEQTVKDLRVSLAEARREATVTLAEFRAGKQIAA